MRWLSKLHKARFKITPEEEYLQIEPQRLEYYLKSLIETRNRYLDRVREIKDQVLAQEIELIRSRPEILVQGHGDFHPRNIFIGRDEPEGGEYVTAIDFGSSYQLPRAFDVGTFLAQYVNMFFRERQVQMHAPSDIFLRTYLDQTRDLEEDFLAQVSLYKGADLPEHPLLSGQSPERRQRGLLAHSHRGRTQLGRHRRQAENLIGQFHALPKQHLASKPAFCSLRACPPAYRGIV